MCVCNSNITSFSLNVSKENEVMLLLHTHRTNEIRETFRENEVIITHTLD
jgi:hypothetical protein